ncbi:MAG: AMP-binding protein, partial [Halobacteria archaeon]|nr:AMP-binding protein [Halobacteria archaeon]
WLTEILENTEPNPPELEFDTDEDLHTLLFTGGTTGRPKGCMITHKNLVANALQNTKAQSQISNMIRGNATILNALPFYHAYGYTVMHTFINLAARQLVVPDPRDKDEMLELVKEYKPLVMMGVPTQFMEIVDGVDGVSMVGVSGSAPLASETKEEYDERSGGGITQGYGLSEMSPVTHFNVRGLLEGIRGEPSDDYDFDMPTIGVPVPDTEVKLADIDTGEEIDIWDAIENEKEGELLVKGPQRMLGYLDEERDPFDDEGFISTGDVVKVDSKGRFYVVDRVKDMINVSGLKVYSEEVDDILHDLEGVKRGATVGVPDPERPGSELVKVYIEQEEGANLTEDEVVKFLEEHVAKHAVPEYVEFLDEIPLTPIGKVDKKELRDENE